VYGEIIDANANTQGSADLWTPRLVKLETSTKGKPVVLGIWDSGVDTTLYPKQLWTNSREQFNGKDDDGNGFVDDVHGIAFGEDHRPAVGPLASLAGLKGDKAQLIGFIAASQDMQAGIQSAEVIAFQNYYRNLKGEELRQFTDDMSLLGSYVHGTHVAGVAVAGNPFARIMHVTENWPYKAIPDTAPTIEDGARWGVATKQAVAYFQRGGARVVNMSWRVGRSAMESMLEKKGVGASPEERAELSRKIFAGLRNGLEEAIRSAPEILFIAGSGNEDNDVDFAEYVPAGLRLPNLITVGAIDDKDKFTSFTTTGKNVELYANGYRIESFIPGGQKIKFSGTSMAAPQVMNLAAKILALKPELTPAQVVTIVRTHADPMPGQAGRFIINPKRTIASIAD
jgi:subtilisin family serine protease